jgi:hypothetical protein
MTTIGDGIVALAWAIPVCFFLACIFLLIIRTMD